MLPKMLLFLYLLAVIASFGCGSTTQHVANTLSLEDANTDASVAAVPRVRVKRGVFWDFFQKMVTTKNLVVDQYVDTRDTLSEVYNLLNEGFSDPAPRKATLRPPSTTTDQPKSSDEDDSDEMATTTEKYAISRYELGRILGRNFRGLQRLTKIELQDAFNQSHYNIEEYKAEAQKQFANSLAVETKNKLKGFKG